VIDIPYKVKGSSHDRPILVAGIYLAFGLLWIYFSDRDTAALFSDPATLTAVQTWKGWAVIAVTAVLVFILARDALR
jgi:hypothetical protein